MFVKIIISSGITCCEALNFGNTREQTVGRPTWCWAIKRMMVLCICKPTKLLGDIHPS